MTHSQDRAISLQDFCAYCDGLLQTRLYDDYCTNGLQVEGRATLQKMAVAVSASLEAIEKAADWGADLLLVHHGIFWKRDTPDVVGLVKDKLKILLTHGISLVAYHLPLDAHPLYGNNWGAALELGWQQLSPFPIADKAPIGVRAVFEPLARELLMELLQEYYQNRCDIVFGGVEQVGSAVLVSGGAHAMIKEAAKVADCFITGSRDEPTWHLAKELGINFFALGHSATETVGPRRLGVHLSELFGLQMLFIEQDNPF